MSDTDSLIKDFAERIRSQRTLPVLHRPFGVTSGAVVAKHPTFEVPPEPVEAYSPPPPPAKPVRPADEKRQLKALRKEALQAEDGRLKQRRKDARKQLADELRSGRKRLRDMKWASDNIEATVRRAVAEKAREVRKGINARLIAARQRLGRLRETIDQESMSFAKQVSAHQPRDSANYPLVPPPTFVPDREGGGLPAAPGIYFLWSGDAIVYVGRSVKLCQRVTLGTHHVLKQEHRISYVVLDERELTWAECYYIGVLRPIENFGAAASHRRP